MYSRVTLDQRQLVILVAIRVDPSQGAKADTSPWRY
jgi:hypothetical protein